VFFLVFRENRPILDAMDVIPKENVIEIPDDGLLSILMGALRVVFTMRRQQLDTAIDLEFFARSSAVMAYLSGARCRVGYHSFGGEASYRGNLMTHRISFNSYLHTSQAFEMLVDAVDFPAGSFPTFPLQPKPPGTRLPSFHPDATEVSQAKTIVTEASGRDRWSPLVLLNANASDLLPLRRWPAERYVTLARKLLEASGDVCIAFTGAPSEQTAIDRLVEQVGSPRCFSLAGRTTLRQLLVIYGLADVLVTNDSGPAHFATLTAVDVVTLFGPETPALFAAVSPRNHVLWAGIVCSPCVNAFNDRQTSCQDNQCMQWIGVEEVYQTVIKILASRRDGALPVTPPPT
jgi:ADP-heptose:LPS heptosyltransferase